MSDAGGDGGDGDTDDLIREIAADPGRPVTPKEVDRILAHVAGSSFPSEELPVRRALRGRSYQGREVRARDDPLFSHLVQRVCVDGQWAEGTTAEEYLLDAREAARHPSARVAVGTPPGSDPLVFLAADNVVPQERRGVKEYPLMMVLYATDNGAIMTIYQASSLEKIRFPGDVRWLR